MIDAFTPIRIFDDTGRGESYEIDNMIYSDENIIVAKIIHSDFDHDVYVIINKHSSNVTSEDFQFYLAENYMPEQKIGITITYKNIANITILKNNGNQR